MSTKALSGLVLFPVEFYAQGVLLSEKLPWQKE
jgi:hypothetical protein